ncbi:uncharacterized protein LOC142170209 [Nicotiana tabacum]|uniref:Uncharacterized protein LOC142170209 n=1 Tax=Nicotiana tabacum TaxID=4097 RepID=A0AC58ST44_TOBAC
MGESEPLSSELASEHEIVIEVSGIIKNRNLSVLVDSGSTHSFIDEQIVKETEYHPLYSTPIRVPIADDSYMYCSSTCPKFTWNMTGKTFKEDLRIIKLGACDIVLGNEWMKKFNPTTFDHEQQTVTIGKKGNRVVLQAIPERGRLSMISSSTMGKILRKGQMMMAHLFLLKVEQNHEQEVVDSAIQEMLAKYEEVLISKEKDETSRFCVDYRVLNEITIKDKYPISIVDDLLDELQGSKCSFGQRMVEYLGHVITVAGVSTDLENIQAMIEWPKPSSVRSLRGFLGLTGYYRKYVQNYGIICRPLTELLRKDAFKWTEEAETSFETLIVAMTNTPALALPDYGQEFIIKIDAGHSGIGGILIQKGRPIPYFSKMLAPIHIVN